MFFLKNLSFTLSVFREYNSALSQLLNVDVEVIYLFLFLIGSEALQETGSQD
jgi:hypothetical protein